MKLKPKLALNVSVNGLKFLETVAEELSCNHSRSLEWLIGNEVHLNLITTLFRKEIYTISLESMLPTKKTGKSLSVPCGHITQCKCSICSTES